MYIPIFYRIEVAARDLVHAIYTCNISEEDAARLKGRMLRKRKINLAVILLGALMLFCGLLLPLILYAINEQVISTFTEENEVIFFVMLGAGFIGFLMVVFAANKCIAVAGEYLRALAIAYPNLTPLPPRRGDSKECYIMGEYNPREYQTGKRNTALTESLESGTVDEARARGLYHYAIAGRSLSRKMSIMAFLLGIPLIALWVYLYTQSIQVFDGSADNIIYLITGGCGGLLLLSGFALIYRYKNNQRHIEGIKKGYPRLFGKQHIS